MLILPEQTDKIVEIRGFKNATSAEFFELYGPEINKKEAYGLIKITLTYPNGSVKFVLAKFSLSNLTLNKDRTGWIYKYTKTIDRKITSEWLRVPMYNRRALTEIQGIDVI